MGQRTPDSTVDEIDRLARRFAERSLGLDSTNVDVRMMLADVLANQLGRTDIAAVVLRAVLRDQPDHVGAMTLLGSIYAQTGLGAPGEAHPLFLASVRRVRALSGGKPVTCELITPLPPGFPAQR